VRHCCGLEEASGSSASTVYHGAGNFLRYRYDAVPQGDAVSLGASRRSDSASLDATRIENNTRVRYTKENTGRRLPRGSSGRNRGTFDQA